MTIWYATNSDNRVADGIYRIDHLNNVIRANAIDRGLPVVDRVLPPHHNAPANFDADRWKTDLLVYLCLLAVPPLVVWQTRARLQARHGM